MWASIVGFFSSLIAVGKRIIEIKPLQYFKDLSDSMNPLSSHNAINLLWGGGSFVFYWVDHFYRVTHKLDYQFTTTDYIFISAMAGISTLSALASKKVDTAAGVVPPANP